MAIKKTFLMTFSMKLFLFGAVFFSSCSNNELREIYDFEIDLKNESINGVMKILKVNDSLEINLSSLDFGDIAMQNPVKFNDSLKAKITFWGKDYNLSGVFTENGFNGGIEEKGNIFAFTAQKQSEIAVIIDRSNIEYLLSESDLPESEKDIDHAGIIADLGPAAYERGSRIYNSICIDCHGNQEMEGSIPLSTKFWNQKIRSGSDAYSMYQTVTRGFGSMPPQITLTPQEKYDVIYFIQESFIRNENSDEYVQATPGYLKEIPKGSNRGPEIKPYHPWSDMDYGNFFMNTYELVDEETGLERYHSPGPSPFKDEDYLKNNFAYKGIAVRLDEGEGGISKGKAWMIFDHDLMRVAGGWTGEGFIDWNAILLNDRHETYPRTVGKLHFETPVSAGWANPTNGKFKDERFQARDGRKFGPLPKEWANYKGLYHNNENIIISYSVGNSDILEKFGLEKSDKGAVFTRNLNISASNSILKMKIATIGTQVEIKGNGATIENFEGFVILNIKKAVDTNVKIFIADSMVLDFKEVVANAKGPESLLEFTKGGGSAHYPEILTSTITKGQEDGLFATDILTPPFQNPWKARMKLSGIDFMKDNNQAVACATDGDIWLISGLTDGSSELKWQRIGSGLFQPLGIKVVDENIFVTCRDQLVLLRDFNGDRETDYYESFNHDHQVTDHFHEFAMGLQADKMGNLYYAKSGRHAREALIPQHGTLIKVKNDGSKSEIIATGFRAANGVCINPDGSFIVTDQQGYWNPMNRINWIEIGEKEKFFGNMWGYNPPKDSSRAAMEQPMVWVDMDFDRSPSELLWVESDKWGPLNGSLLSFSYGYGKIQLVMHEKIKGQMQGGVIDLPNIKFATGVMRGRFNPSDGHLYACGMSAWGTSQLMKGGGLYRIRYTGKPLTFPLNLHVKKSGILLEFATLLDKNKAENIVNYKVETWDLLRSKKYGSDRLNRQSVSIVSAKILEDGKSIMLKMDNIKPVDVMTISYDIMDTKGQIMKGVLQNTIHKIGD